jgi:UDP-N-acetylmuramate--alanine ligase
VSSELIYQAAKKAGNNIIYIPELDEAEDYVTKNLKKEDLLITMGAGNIWMLGMNVVERLRN